MTTTDPKTSPVRRVLLVEDSEFVHQLYRVAFRRLGGWDVAHAYNGRQGLDAVLRQRPDLVVVDLQMPVMGGLEFLEQVGRLAPEQRPHHCMVASTEGADPQIKAAIGKGAQSFLKKPFTLDQFLTLIGRITETLPPPGG